MAHRDGAARLTTAPFWLVILGAACSVPLPEAPDLRRAGARFGALYRLLDNKYYLDRINDVVFAGGARLLARCCGRRDVRLMMVSRSTQRRIVGWVASASRLLQSGYITTMPSMISDCSSWSRCSSPSATRPAQPHADDSNSLAQPGDLGSDRIRSGLGRGRRDRSAAVVRTVALVAASSACW